MKETIPYALLGYHLVYLGTFSTISVHIDYLFLVGIE